MFSYAPRHISKGDASNDQTQKEESILESYDISQTSTPTIDIEVGSDEIGDYTGKVEIRMVIQQISLNYKNDRTRIDKT